ncbi:uncharacterized protein EDB91DRAFT_839099 [Suillus paluster]|uniref:uncharacterized protein n=1 Tax=Suillus paluster TaxID=48578 RepID=UPI001B883AB5|nr:uncharacterized protein EDB91DRAFT_839099 [Suillus paluster]KAG1729094.1 hypothetical protein EDB91DRAFT_839099 [Suillus paluster]
MALKEKLNWRIMMDLECMSASSSRPYQSSSPTHHPPSSPYTPSSVFKRGIFDLQRPNPISHTRRTTMAPSSSTTFPSATATSSVNEPHKHAFPFAALILLALCIAYIASYLIYRRIVNSWSATQATEEKVQNFPDEFFEKKPRGVSKSVSRFASDS